MTLGDERMASVKKIDSWPSGTWPGLQWGAKRNDPISSETKALEHHRCDSGSPIVMMPNDHDASSTQALSETGVKRKASHNEINRDNTWAGNPLNRGPSNRHSRPSSKDSGMGNPAVHHDHADRGRCPTCQSSHPHPTRPDGADWVHAVC